ncbi:cob(I)yrinic acid a,c-diamide adenosyltransferase [Desulfofundulus thermocisternus]|uniref:cob(I)yrinic acid a,c-diamide adenosyltransferase n=1 Tax=Desulfofundulus thermocisternus TaxID=42471 RepID=UPI0019EE9A91|nr:cob(I)yrinic acid a,c-diamide adenosyltransferase [Desulfofundulus thermocisternus]MBE3585859.1 cob(I)yrinic acid a,c-diamide adenosyltransferase [Thermoanaerobacter sp.]MCS5696441.1 cob(I)yrinic acid a,c-diamide adenosyltransferase [Desulfofundulus thermocisternus]
MKKKGTPGLYTRTGDRGETSLLGGIRVGKDSLRVSAYGTVDEAGAALALGRSLASCTWVQEVAARVQQDLFVVCSELARPEVPAAGARVEDGMISRLEEDINEGLERIPALRGFAVSGHIPAEAAFDLARTITRRAERMVVRLSRRELVREEVIRYLNRLSDLLFVLARVEAHEHLVRVVVNKVLEKTRGGHKVHETITLDLARQIAAAAEEKAHQIGVPMVIVVADGAGNPVLLERMPGALLASLDIAAGKAFTAVALKMETEKLSELAAPGGPLYGINTTNGGKIVPFGGGIPLYRGSDIVGAIGISGGSVEEDIEVARAGVEKWNQLQGQ